MIECPIGNDCNDNDPTIHPGATEIYCNGVDEDCSGSDDCGCVDNDGDGAPGLTVTCPMGFDCDDDNPNRFPGNVEIKCNGIDENCDYLDQCECTDNDGDGYGIEGGICSPGGEIDCNDNNPNIHPNAAEIYCNGIDEDCNGVDECSCFDNDGDGFYGRTQFCPNGQDCDDGVSSINPDADEICYNWIDENCDGMRNEGCHIVCDTNADCLDGRVCINNECTCPHGLIHDLFANDGSIVCDPIGVPVDTPCTGGWPNHQGGTVDYNEDVHACDLFEVNKGVLLYAASMARDCCVSYHLNGVADPWCHGHTKTAYDTSGLATALNYDNMRRCIGLYEIYGNGPEAEYMQGYYHNELDCGHDKFAGFGSGCLGSTWLEECCNGHHWYCTLGPVSCYDGVHFNTGKLDCKEDVGSPSGWANDIDLGRNGCCFSDLPAHVSMSILNTGTCVDYSLSLIHI